MDFYHAAVIQGGKYARNSFVICKTQPAGGVLLKMIKYFEIMLNIFEFSPVWKTVVF